MVNPKSDVGAKAAFAAELRRRGYQHVSVTGGPADITAYLDGDAYYFELKFTKQDKDYFGAATLTEWEAALANEDRFKFVVAEQRGERWVFTEYTPEEFMRFSSIPPFKVYFNVQLGTPRPSRGRRSTTAVRLTRERLAQMSELYRSFRPQR